MSPDDISKSLVDGLTTDAHAQVDRHREHIEAAIYQATLSLRSRCEAAEAEVERLTKAYLRVADALGWAREIGKDEVEQYDAMATLRSRCEAAEAEVKRQRAVIAGTAYPTDATLTKEQAFHGWHVANQQREGWMSCALAAEARSERLEGALKEITIMDDSTPIRAITAAAAAKTLARAALADEGGGK